jgi:hypothetical protein
MTTMSDHKQQLDSASPPQKVKYKRRQLLINKRVQMLLIVHSLVIALLGAFAAYAIQTTLTLTTLEGTGVHPFRLYAIILIPACLIWAGFLWGLVVSHRIVGPIFRITRHIIEVTQGKTHSPVSLRKGDYFQELAEAYNTLLKKHVFKDSDNKDGVA